MIDGSHLFFFFLVNTECIYFWKYSSIENMEKYKVVSMLRVKYDNSASKGHMITGN